jgi:hypothetical protein
VDSSHPIAPRALVFSGPHVPRGGSGPVTDPDEAVRTAIKAAVDAGRSELAARLLDLLQEPPKPGALVRLETVKRAR